MSDTSLVQEQRILFHRLQQIIEADGNARVAVQQHQQQEVSEATIQQRQQEEKTKKEGHNKAYIVTTRTVAKEIMAEVEGRRSQDIHWGCGLLFFLVTIPIATFFFLINSVQVPASQVSYGSLILLLILLAYIVSSEINEWKYQKNMAKTYQQEYQNRITMIQRQHEQTIAKLDQERSQKLTALRSDLIKFIDDASLWGHAWEHESWSQWSPATTIQLATRIGTFLPRHEILPAAPAFINCPGNENLLFQVSDDTAQTSAYQAIQSIMLRLLALQPPGKVRFTLIDPSGLGKNVETFMQLADHDEKLVGTWAWYESSHIEEQLTKLSDHMASVIQKYLQGQFSTVEEYNVQAGEVAEPYRVLVVTDFPTKFSPEAVRRLIEIATNGPRCGVFTIIMHNISNRQHAFSRSKLEQASVVLTWGAQGFAWLDPDYGKCQLQLDQPPELPLFNHILQEVGKTARLAGEVKVPFERVIPPENQWWQAGTRDGIRIALGRAGASKLQFLELGKGTAHHALVIGKTGSGKTNLLHVLLTNLALTYSPLELELYLIDFKTVGFTPYATHQLPHARVIATQSEREFGLSVLKGLSDLLEKRKRILSDAQTQTITQYRLNHPEIHLPRILLLIDEFQEFFTNDDTIAGEAAASLEELARQGRAFGMHIMLSSQTLVGSYAHTLTRATIANMDVRIALQCEDDDSRLILREDNPVARWLSRPGEAIYNASNGRLDGNSPFQCALLDEEELKYYLERIHAYSQRFQHFRREQQIIFEGEANANVEKNGAFAIALTAPYASVGSQKATAWIGDPIALKEAITVQFIPQAENNLIMVGQQNEAALGMHLTTLLSLATHHHPARASFYIFNFMPLDTPFAGYINAIRQTLPHQIHLVTRHTLAHDLPEISNELIKRIDANDAGNGSIYLFIYGLQRVRAIRPDETIAYSALGDGSELPSFSKQFATILHDGPEFGVHTIAWCDTYNNLIRSLERGVLDEFGLRIIFQCSTEDSFRLIDTPEASKLGAYRAILYSEETETEKFRPYRVPSAVWLQNAVAAIRQKSLDKE